MAGPSNQASASALYRDDTINFLSVLAIRHKIRSSTQPRSGHNEYTTWASHKADNCCNNMDCGVLNDDEWRETTEGTEINISGQWCPVRPEHFIIRGKSPDWSKAHACIQPDVKYSTGRKMPCERLRCFSGTPKY